MHDIISLLWKVPHLKLLSFTRGEGGWDSWLKKPMLDPHTRHKFTKLFFVTLWQKYIRGMLGVEPLELSAEDEEWQTLINETTYSETDGRKRNSRWQYGISSSSQTCIHGQKTFNPWPIVLTLKRHSVIKIEIFPTLCILLTFWGLRGPKTAFQTYNEHLCSFNMEVTPSGFLQCLIMFHYILCSYSVHEEIAQN